MKAVFASALLCCSLTAHAAADNTSGDNIDTNEDKLNLMLSAGLTFGGDDLASTTEGASVTSGGLIYLAIGGVYHVSPNLDVQAALGYHFDTVSAENGSADFTRTFIELMPFYVMGNGNRLGVGATGVMSPEFSGPFGGGIQFDDTVGLVIQYDWKLASGAYIGLRYADLAYQSSDGLIMMPGGSITDEIDGSYIGLMLQANF